MAFVKYLVVVIWLDSCKYLDNHISFIIWDMIIIWAVLLEYRRVFSNINYIITSL